MLLLDLFFEMSCKLKRVEISFKTFTIFRTSKLPPCNMCQSVSFCTPFEIETKFEGEWWGVPPPDSLMSVFDGRRGSRQRNGIKALGRGNQTPGMTGWNSGPLWTGSLDLTGPKKKSGSKLLLNRTHGIRISTVLYFLMNFIPSRLGLGKFVFPPEGDICVSSLVGQNGSASSW